MNVEEALDFIKDLEARLSAYHHALGLLYYDGATTAPKQTAANRAHSMGILSSETYKLINNKDTITALDTLEDHADQLSANERRAAYLIRKNLKQVSQIPQEEYADWRRLMVEAEDIWHTAKEKSDFAMFEPVLQKVFETYAHIAGLCAPDTDPLEYWLSESEEGMTCEKVEDFFDVLRAHIVPLLKKIQQQTQIDHTPVEGEFPVWKQHQLSLAVMDIMGLDRGHVGISTTEHPFMTSLGSHYDTRITTHYYENDFSKSLFSVMHEGGHALYETGSLPELAWTPLDGGASMSMHESQSRFYENYIGRSEGFITALYPTLTAIFPELEVYTPEEIYRAVNRVQASLIRIQADELTYSLHIMIRYEIEKAIFAGNVQIHDLPELWNAKYKAYLGIDVPDDKRGVLQDSHWAGGNIGYFPSYALGNAYGAQFLKAMKQEVDVDACLKEGNLAPVNDWNRRHIWQYGQTLPPTELFEKATGTAFDPTVYTTYLEEKFTKLYHL